MPGYEAAASFRHGKVHKNAFASKQDTCNWLRLNVLDTPCFNKGMPQGIISGNRSARFIIPGKIFSKKCSDSSSSKT